jgi:toxin ParE1/3/4
MDGESAFQVIWSDAALNDISEIDNFIARDNPTSADDLVRRIVAKTRLLANHPRLGTVFVRTRQTDVRATLAGRYRIFYAVDEQLRRIQILHIWHGARQQPNFD